MNSLVMMIILILAVSQIQVAFCQYSDEAYSKTGLSTQGYDPTNSEFPTSNDEEAGDSNEEQDDQNYDEYYDYNYEEYEYYEENGNLDYTYYNYYDYLNIQEGDLETFIATLNCEVNLGVELQGGDNGTQNYFEANSFRDCAIICGMNSGCNKYTYINQGGENTGCYLKKSSNYISVANVHAVSGDGCLDAVYPQEE